MNHRTKGMVFELKNSDKPAQIEPHWRVPDWFSHLDSGAINKLSLYHSELMRFNDKINLISPSTKEHADEIHFADSIIASLIMKDLITASKIFDIGSGNGFPGLIFAILNPDKEVVLLDSDQRKSEFLKIMTGRLDLNNCSVLNVKLEQIPDNSIECAISRAFAPLSKALVLSRKKFTKGGSYFHMKTDSWGSEISKIPVQVCSYWSNELVGEYELPESRKRLFIIASKKES